MNCVIIGGADINNYEKLKTYFSGNDYFIFCDGGLKHKEKLGVKPDLTVGDFDSFEKPKTDVETILLPKEKDDTDLFFAAKEAVRRGFENFIISGAIGNRFDHSMVNISVLLYLYNQHKKAIIVDDCSEILIAGKEKVFVPDSFSFFSLIPFCGDVKGVNISGAKYNLKNGKINADYIYSCSNEVLPGKTAEVYVKKGLVLLVKDF